jgi:hypothetical protein
MQSLTRFLKRVGSDIAAGKNLEGYAISLVAFALALIGVLDNAVSIDLKIAAILAAVGLLVFKSTAPEGQNVDLDAVLLDRQSYGSFREFIAGAQELWIYGPSAVNVLRSAGEIKMEVLDRGGNLRVLLQNPDSALGMDVLTKQLDKVYDLGNDIKTSLGTLERMANWKITGKVEYGLLDYSPGFSLTVVDPNNKNGRLIIEFYGYQNELINDRMHIVITRQQSQYWFEYWSKQFEIMWDSRKPLP